MTPASSLGELEQLLLMALLRLPEEKAYGAALRRELMKVAGRDVSPGTIYPTMDRLEAKGFVRSYMGEPTGERGGRARRHFVLLPSGLTALRRAWREIRGLASGVEGLLEEGT